LAVDADDVQAASGKAEEWPIPGLYRPRRQRRRSSPGRRRRRQALERHAL